MFGWIWPGLRDSEPSAQEPIVDVCIRVQQKCVLVPIKTLKRSKKHAGLTQRSRTDYT